MEIFYETCIWKKLSLLARVRFFDQFLSGASLFVCPSVHICFLIVYFSSRTTGMISTKLDPKQHWVKEVSFFLVFFYMKGHTFFKGIQFVFIDTLFLLFKESSSQKPLNQKSCILCRNILRWYRFTFVHIMIPVGSVEVSTFYTGICWEILFYNIFLSKRLAKNAVTCVGWYRFKCVKIMIPVGWMGSQERGVKYLDRNILKKWTIHISKTTCPVKL